MPPLPQELGVRPALDDPAPVDHEDHVRRQDRREPVRDRDRGSAVHERHQRRLDQPLRGRVERRGRLVQDQDPRILQDDPGDREPLLLAARELVAAFAHDRVVPLGELRDPVVDVRGARRGVEFLLGRVGAPVEQVPADRRVEQVGLLRDDADQVAERLELQVAHVDPVDLHRAALHVVQPRDQVRHRRLAGTGRPDQRRELPGFDRQGDVLQRPLPRRLVREIQIAG